MFFKSKARRVVLKSKEEIALMRQAGRIVARALEAIVKEAKAGISTGQLNEVAEAVLRQSGAEPVFKGYPSHKTEVPPFPATITACVNEELVHGIPRYTKILREGDILTVDCGAYFKGWVGDAAVTIPVGNISEEAQHLLQVTEQALYEGIAQARLNHRTEDISAAIQSYVEPRGYAIVRDYTGHGVGRDMHEDPQVPNFGQRGRGMPLKKGMTIALEPMVNAGTWETKVLRDGWTVVTADGRLCAHFEHSVAITDGEPEILTLL